MTKKQKRDERVHIFTAILASILGVKILDMIVNAFKVDGVLDVFDAINIFLETLKINVAYPSIT